MVLDLGGRAGQLLLQNVPWYVAIELITGAKPGQLISSQSGKTDSGNTRLALRDVPTLKSGEQQAPVFGLITQTTRQALTVQTTTDTYGIASAKQFNTHNALAHLEQQELESGDAVKTLPIKIDYAGKQTVIDIDTESARHHKHATSNEKNTVMGFVAGLHDNTTTVALGDDLQGLMETDTSEQATTACELLKHTLLELDVIDYDPDSNTINLQNCVG